MMMTRLMMMMAKGKRVFYFTHRTDTESYNPILVFTTTSNLSAIHSRGNDETLGLVHAVLAPFSIDPYESQIGQPNYSSIFKRTLNKLFFGSPTSLTKLCE